MPVAPDAAVPAAVIPFRLEKRRVHDAAYIFASGGADDTKRFLANLGFVDGSRVSVVSELSGNMIVTVKDARVAINKEMAKHVMLQ